jgi:uncharacterized oligopeptide transporter (OPT) family protein
MKKFLLFLMIAGVYVLHQDSWNWKSTDVVFGILPVGLAYHAGYSILAAVMMGVLVRFAWPEHLEQSEPHDSPDKKKKDDE